MGVQIQPDSPTPQPIDDSQLPPDSQESTSDQIPPTNPAPASHTEPDAQTRYVQLLEETLREQAKQIREQGQQIEEVHRHVTAPPPPAPVDPEEQRRRYYEDPRRETREVVKELLDETIGPLRQFVDEMRGQSVVQREIANVKADPRFAQHWDAAVENAVNAAIAAVPPDKVNGQFITAATIQAIGMKAAGLLGNPGNNAPPPNPNLNPTPSNNQPTVTNPPHMRPSAPTPPRNNPNNTQKPVLNELEKRLARERGQSEEEYIKWRDMPATEVAFSDVGKPPKK